MKKLQIVLMVFFFGIGCASHHQGPEAVENGVRFTLSAPMARSVAIAGSFNRWDSHRDMLIPADGRGFWSITLPLPPGRYEYRFVINGETWVLDPAAPEIDDGMGGKNSLLIVEDKPTGK